MSNINKHNPSTKRSETDDNEFEEELHPVKKNRKIEIRIKKKNKND